eukprot:7932419-Alexandrium_andersonii.AAC.1
MDADNWASRPHTLTGEGWASNGGHLAGRRPCQDLGGLTGLCQQLQCGSQGLACNELQRVAMRATSPQA